MALAACGQKPAAPSASDTLTVAATAIPHAEVLEFIKPKLAADGLKIEIKVFNDYVQPNTQVAEKRIDVSYFETLPYLETFNRDKGTNLVPIKGVHIEPMGPIRPSSNRWPRSRKARPWPSPTTPAPRAEPCCCCRATASSP
jgi:D-methionine transport system substrate-binding protein